MKDVFLTNEYLEDVSVFIKNWWKLNSLRLSEALIILTTQFFPGLIMQKNTFILCYTTETDNTDRAGSFKL